MENHGDEQLVQLVSHFSNRSRASHRHENNKKIGQYVLNYAVSYQVSFAAILLGTISLGSSGTASAQIMPPTTACPAAAGIVNCSGDLSSGVEINTGSGFSTLNINGLTADISPASGTSGILFESANSIVINSDTDIYTITTTGASASGIHVDSPAPVTVTIDHQGSIATSGNLSYGIDIFFNNTGVSVTHTGDISTLGDDAMGIRAASLFGSVAIEQSGHISTIGDGADGISIRSFSDVASVEHNGSITTRGDYAWGIFVEADGDVSVAQSGYIATSGDKSSGIELLSNDGNISLTLGGGAISSDLAEAVSFLYGADNLLTINDAVTLNGGTYDVLGDNGNETVENNGTLTSMGIIDLGTGTNAFNNNATFNSSNVIILGAGNLLTNDGLISPGGANTIATTALTGDFQNTSAGALLITLDPTATIPNDVLEISGSATLDGGQIQVSGVTTAPTGTYRIFTADSITGTFDDIVDTLFIDWQSTYNADSIDIFASSKGDTFCDIAATANQHAVACNGLDSLPPTNDITQAVLALTSTQEGKAAFDALSGEINPSAKSALLENSQRTIQAVNNRLHGSAEPVDTQMSIAAYGDTTSEDNHGLWLTGYGLWQDTGATGNTAQMDNHFGGVVFGLDREFDDRWRIGLLGGYSESDVTQDSRSSSASADSWSLGLYGSLDAGATRISYGGIYNWHGIDTNRQVAFSGFSQNLSASYDAQSWQLFAEAGHRIQTGDLVFEPFAGIAHINLDTQGFSETGGSAALTAAASTDSTTFTTLGLRNLLNINDSIRLYSMLGWRYGFGDIQASSTFTLAGSNPFTITGAPIAQNALVTQIGLEATVANSAILGISYDGQFGDDTAAHGLNADMTMHF